MINDNLRFYREEITGYYNELLILVANASGDDGIAHDIVQEAIDQLLLGGWGNLTPNEVLRHEIGRRLTLEPPADLLRDQTALNQIPSEPSKSASSRRALTWLKKRAASAPSTMR